MQCEPFHSTTETFHVPESQRLLVASLIVGPEMVCPEFSQVILTLSSTKLARTLFLAPVVFLLPAALFLLVILVST